MTWTVKYWLHGIVVSFKSRKCIYCKTTPIFQLHCSSLQKWEESAKPNVTNLIFFLRRKRENYCGVRSCCFDNCLVESIFCFVMRKETLKWDHYKHIENKTQEIVITY